ncbi:Sec-independent protein translocase subunit TatA [Corynebacterium epidermidicanis]|uniref:Sec-independent protein translocase protein TatA n=1 Tax=Corynebacterium epidermidicanis TaxID=1050174 RepID=A0A0G3GUD3_9CORY|nr:Sec-independent protein translocase subunit TatA [Corynebacterium epidermidicanis]AKK03133.1 twin arginine-targeting protein translocase, TatA/E family [Corynebacterium epidermidicanis]
MPNLGPTELIIIAVLVILLFGAKKLPDAARSLGRSMRIFKSEVKEMQNDDQQPAQPQLPQGYPQQQAQGYAQPVQQPYPQQLVEQAYPQQPAPGNQQYPQNPAQ